MNAGNAVNVHRQTRATLKMAASCRAWTHLEAAIRFERRLRGEQVCEEAQITSGALN
jgi:hypothetical protein